MYDIVVLSFGYYNTCSVCTEFLDNFLYYTEDRITLTIHDLSSNEIVDRQQDFILILIANYKLDYETVVDFKFYVNFLDKSLKIFIVLDLSEKSILHAVTVWKRLSMRKYFNIYLVIQNENGVFDVYRTIFRKNIKNEVMMVLNRSKDEKFLAMKDVLDPNDPSPLYIVFYGANLMNFVDNGKIIGAEGNLIQEFSNRLGTFYQIINQKTELPTTVGIHSYLDSYGDISLETGSTFLERSVKNVFINEMSGLCLLVPRNIPVSAINNFNLAIDQLVLILMSTVSVIICWYLITTEMTYSSILSAVYKIILKRGASGIERISLREKILVYTFIFSSFILVSLYESVVISAMLAEPSMRSANSIKELNDLDAKFFLYLNNNASKLTGLPYIREDLIINFISEKLSVILKVPNDFDENLVYFVFCIYADAFIQSMHNYRDGLRLFDKITLMEIQESYLVSSGYYYIDEFVQFVDNLMTSGFYKFWQKQTLENRFPSANPPEQFQHMFVKFKDMALPMIILLAGLLISLLIFLVETILFKWKDYIEAHVNSLNNRINRRKLNISKWRKKFIIDRKPDTIKCDQILPTRHPVLSNIPINCKSNYIACRESMRGGYFVFENQKKPIKHRKVKHQIIQVKPCNQN
ncbi:unnamed protein product [Chironomus riparius]|uniref:Ionotropic receptor n=1 Tax=Chironomus riparius TaxID=315576 RepID=A0A9N9S2X4_9DIPT|nr:unnamed protein product [Chironomus riparius]